jgi:Kef-type K+ transport system membrane component KefB
MFCRQCLYVLDGLPANRCPECGREFDPSHPETYLLQPKIPVPWECNVAMGCAIALILILLAGELDQDAIIAGTLLTPLAVAMSISGLRRKGSYRKRRGWFALVVSLPWVVILVLAVMDAIALQRSCNWYRFHFFWGLHP